MQCGAVPPKKRRFFPSQGCLQQLAGEDGEHQALLLTALLGMRCTMDWKILPWTYRLD